MTRSPEALRELARAATQASDAQLMRLVRTLDAMPQRGQADDLLQPVRRRLRGLRPPRPLNLPRLLFLPLDPLLVPPRDWRPGRGQVPRSAIGPIAEAVAAASPELAGPLRLALEGHTMDGTAPASLGLVSCHGERLWSAAAQLDPGRPMPGWAETGLPAAARAEILATCGILWRQGARIWRLRIEGPLGPPEASARSVLGDLAREEPAALGLVLAATMPFAAQPTRLAVIAATLGGTSGGGASPAADQALDRFIATLDPALDDASLGDTARSAERLTALIEDLLGSGAAGPAGRAQQLRGLRQSAGQSCLRRLEAEAGPHLAAALGSLAAAPEITDAAMEMLEGSVASVRMLADAARRLDRAPAAEAALRPAILALQGQLPRLPDGGAGLRRADALRLLELLDGPERTAAFQAGASTLSR